MSEPSMLVTEVNTISPDRIRINGTSKSWHKSRVLCKPRVR